MNVVSTKYKLIRIQKRLKFNIQIIVIIKEKLPENIELFYMKILW